MGILKLPKRFQTNFSNPLRKPTGEFEIDWSNPLTRGLVLYTAPEIGVIRNIATAQPYSITTGTPVAVVDNGEVVLNCDGSTGLSTPLGSAPDATNKVTIACCAYANQTTNIETCISFGGDGGSTALNRIMFLDTGVLRYQVRGDAGSAINIDGGTYSVGEKVIMMGVSEGASKHRLFVDGIQLNSVSTTTDSPTVWKFMSIGGIYRGVALGWQQHLTGGLIWTAAWDRDLTPDEARSLADNPYQLLKPKNPAVYFTAAVAGALNLSPTGIASAESIGTPVVTTGAVDLSPMGIASAESFGSHTISTATFLTPNGIASAESFGSPVLTTGAVTLSTTGIPSEESFGAAVITQGFLLQPTGIASEESFGAVTITVGAVNLTATGIASAEAFGSHTVTVAGAKEIKIDFQDEIVIATNLQSKTLYFNGTNYFTID